jgi:hypothetical protein
MSRLREIRIQIHPEKWKDRARRALARRFNLAHLCIWEASWFWLADVRIHADCRVLIFDPSETDGQMETIATRVHQLGLAVPSLEMPERSACKAWVIKNALAAIARAKETRRDRGWIEIENALEATAHEDWLHTGILASENLGRGKSQVIVRCCYDIGVMSSQIRIEAVRGTDQQVLEDVLVSKTRRPGFVSAYDFPVVRLRIARGGRVECLDSTGSVLGSAALVCLEADRPPVVRSNRRRM